MRRASTCFVLLLGLAAAAAHAVPVPCEGASTLADLLFLTPGGGCFVQDKLFSGFSYSLGEQDAALVSATLVFQTGSGPDVHGWTFAREGGWTSGFTLAYTVSVDPPSPGVAITASKDQIDPGPIPSSTAVTDTQTAATLSLSGASAATVGAQAIYGGVTSLTTTSVATLPEGSILASYSQLFYQNTADLSIVKSDGTTTAPIGGSTVYTIVVTNFGPTDVVGATVTDTLPAAISSATWECVASAGSSCTASGNGSINDTVNLLAGGTATYVLTASISPTASGSLLNVASVAAPAGVTESNPANNSASDLDTLAEQIQGPLQIPGLTSAGLVLLTMLLAGAGALLLKWRSG